MPTVWYKERRTKYQRQAIYNILRSKLNMSRANALRLRDWSFGHIKMFVISNVKGYNDKYKLEVLDEIKKILEEGGDEYE